MRRRVNDFWRRGAYQYQVIDLLRKGIPVGMPESQRRMGYRFTAYFGIARAPKGRSRPAEILTVDGNWFQISDEWNWDAITIPELVPLRSWSDQRSAEVWLRRYRYRMPQAWEWVAAGAFISIEIGVAVIAACCTRGG